MLQMLIIICVESKDGWGLGKGEGEWRKGEGWWAAHLERVSDGSTQIQQETTEEDDEEDWRQTIDHILYISASNSTIFFLIFFFFVFFSTTEIVEQNYLC